MIDPDFVEPDTSSWEEEAYFMQNRDPNVREEPQYVLCVEDLRPGVWGVV